MEPRRRRSSSTMGDTDDLRLERLLPAMAAVGQLVAVYDVTHSKGQVSRLVGGPMPFRTAITHETNDRMLADWLALLSQLFWNRRTNSGRWQFSCCRQRP